MRLLRPLGAVLLVASGLTGCIPGLVSFSARESEHRFKLEAPDRIRQGEILTFSVEMTTSAGDRVPEETTYGWILDWPDVKGRMRSARAFEDQHQEAKCSPGTAVLRIYAKNASNRIVQVLRKDIPVE
jgi:hypothetical protein